MLGEPLFYWGGRSRTGTILPLGQFPPNVAVGLLNSVRVLYASNLHTAHGPPIRVFMVTE